jgi:RNA polymerase sigma factor (sigma-70 family)
MPGKTKRVYLSDLNFEPMAKTHATDWTTRSQPPVESEELRMAVDSLSQTQRQVIRQRFGLEGLPQTLDVIGRALGCTRERVRQVEKVALARLKNQLAQSRR